MEREQTKVCQTEGGIKEQEIAMWKHTASVYEQRYENMRLMVNVSVLVSTGTIMIATGLILLSLLK